MSIIRISANLIRRISQALSYLSASCPAVVENKKNGRINRPAAKLVRKLVLLSEAEMPLLLCGQLHTSWMAIDGALRRSSARLRQVRRSAVRRLAANWLLSFGPHVVPLGPPAAPVVAPAAAAQPAAMDVVVAAPAAVAVAAAVADDVPCARCTLVRPCVALCAECCGECCDSYSAWVAR